MYVLHVDQGRPFCGLRATLSFLSGQLGFLLFIGYFSRAHALTRYFEFEIWILK